MNGTTSTTALPSSTTCASPMPAPKLLLTAATYHDSTGNMSTNLTTWQEPLDYVILMNHDVFGPATSPFLNDVAGKTPHVAGPSAARQRVPLAKRCILES